MKKYLLIVTFSIIFLSGLFLIQYRKFNDGLLHVVFCNVGQGDAVFIRSPTGKIILFDQGPDDAVLSCLSHHMPFWQRDLSLIMVSHPHADHFRGLFPILDRYNVGQFVSEELANNSAEYQAITQMISDKQIQKVNLLRNDRFKISENLAMSITGPEESFLKATSPGGTVGERKEFASLTALLTYGSFKVLLTGDAQSPQILSDMKARGIKQIDVLQVPHHGSATGLTAEIVQRLDPKIAVISVGKNRYGHPSQKTMKILRDEDIKILRTDKDGDIEILSDGNKWWLRK